MQEDQTGVTYAEGWRLGARAGDEAGGPTSQQEHEAFVIRCLCEKHFPHRIASVMGSDPTSALCAWALQRQL